MPEKKKIKKPVFNKLEKSTLKSIEKKIASGIQLDNLAEFLLEDLKKIIPINRLDLGFCEDENQRIVLFLTKTDYSPVLLERDTAIDVFESLFERSISNKIFTIFKNIKMIKNFRSKNPVSHLIKEGIRSVIILPVIIEGNAAGILMAGSRTAGAYNERSQKILDAILNGIQLIIEKTYRLQQIEKTTRTYIDMLSIVSHEIKSPLSSIITLGKTLSQGYFGKIDEKHRELIEKIVKHAEYLHAMSSDYLSLARFESGDFSIKPQLVDFLDEIIEPAIDVLKPQVDERRMKLAQDYIENIYPVNCDPNLIKIVFVNLLSNAVKYGRPGGEIKISMKYGFKKLKVSVWNEGPGFTDDDKKRLFRKFSRLQAKELVEKKGTGIGLYVSWRIIKLHGGIIRAESEKNKWAEFYFELPRYMDMCLVD